MQIYLMRHGEALSGAQDPLRPLSEKGVQEVSKLGVFLKNANIPIEGIYHSTVLRAKQTGELIANIYNFAKIEQAAYLEPENNVEALMAGVSYLPANTLIVGHLPNLELCCNNIMTASYHKPTLSFFPASIACFMKEESTWILKWLIDPVLL